MGFGGVLGFGVCLGCFDVFLIGVIGGRMVLEKGGEVFFLVVWGFGGV